MKVRFLSSIAGLNFSYNANDEAEIKDDEAKRLVKAGIAEEIKAKKPVKKGK